MQPYTHEPDRDHVEVARPCPTPEVTEVIVAIGIDRIRARPSCAPAGTGAFAIELDWERVDHRPIAALDD